MLITPMLCAVTSQLFPLLRKMDSQAHAHPSIYLWNPEASFCSFVVRLVLSTDLGDHFLLGVSVDSALRGGQLCGRGRKGKTVPADGLDGRP